MHSAVVFCSLLLCCVALPSEHAAESEHTIGKREVAESEHVIGKREVAGSEHGIGKRDVDEHVIGKRDADEDLEQLLQSIQRHHSDDGDDDKREGRDGGDSAERALGEDDAEVEDREFQVYAELEKVETRTMTGITPAQAKAIVDQHNKLRLGEGASDMEKMKWNPKLASLAQTWAQGCRAVHDHPPFNPTDIGFTKDKLGQSYYSWSASDFTIAKGVQAWFDEKKFYDYNSGRCSKEPCGHYTALVWAKTTEVGCGLVYCPSVSGGSGLTLQQLMFCNYAPGGNDGSKPYQKGTPCTQCNSGKFFCDKGLCDSTCSKPSGSCQCKAACKKCGKKTNDCKCDCPAGTSGVDCSKDCADQDPKCGVNGGYPEFTCNAAGFEFVKTKCPKLCKICKPSDGKPCRKRDSERTNSLKRLLVGYLQSELDAEEEDIYDE